MGGAANLMPRIDEARSRLQSANNLLSETQEIPKQETIAKPLAKSERTGVFGRARDVVDDFVEPVLTTAAGSFLGFIAAGPLGAVMGGLNGAFTGVRDIYDWSSEAGWGAFLSDSTWGLFGTSLGNAANVYNSIVDPSSYRADLSERQNRQVFDGGFQPPLDPSAAITLGNVVSNLQGNDSDLLDHETVHIQQNRLFGSLYLTSYASWSILGGAAGLVAAPFTEQDWQTDVRDMAYVNNPWERWAYTHGGDCGGGELAIDDC